MIKLSNAVLALLFSSKRATAYSMMEPCGYRCARETLGTSSGTEVEGAMCTDYNQLSIDSPDVNHCAKLVGESADACSGGEGYFAYG